MKTHLRACLSAPNPQWLPAHSEWKPKPLCPLRSNPPPFGSLSSNVVAHSTRQLDWATGRCWAERFLGVSVRVFLDELRIGLGRLSPARPSRGGWAPRPEGGGNRRSWWREACAPSAWLCSSWDVGLSCLHTWTWAGTDTLVSSGPRAFTLRPELTPSARLGLQLADGRPWHCSASTPWPEPSPQSKSL